MIVAASHEALAADNNRFVDGYELIRTLCAALGGWLGGGGQAVLVVSFVYRHHCWPFGLGPDWKLLRALALIEGVVLAMSH